MRAAVRIFLIFCAPVIWPLIALAPISSFATNLGCRLRSLVASLIVAIIILGSGLAGIEQAKADSCPGTLTADGLACCAEGTTPTATDSCMLDNGNGVAASCPIAFVTGNTCCMRGEGYPCEVIGSVVYGTNACPLYQLSLSSQCCPIDQAPQADGSCAPVPSCPAGYTLEPFINHCTAPGFCPPGQQPINTPGGTGVPPYSYLPAGCCPQGSQATDVVNVGMVCVGPVEVNGVVQDNTVVPSLPPSCPPGWTGHGYMENNIFICSVEPTCPPPYVIFRFPRTPVSGVDTVFSCWLPSVMPPSPSMPPPSMMSARPRQGCAGAFVPREAYAGDTVCVEPRVHDRAIADNIAAPSRTLPNGLCMRGYLWRRARPEDHVCVTPETRAQTQSDNQRAAAQVQQAPTAPPQPGRVDLTVQPNAPIVCAFPSVLRDGHCITVVRPRHVPPRVLRPVVVPHRPGRGSVKGRIGHTTTIHRPTRHAPAFHRR